MSEEQKSLQTSDGLGVYRKTEMSMLLTEEQMQGYETMETSKQLHIAHLVISGISYDEAKLIADQYSG